MDTKLLKQKILDLAIRGKLVPQDPNDEPASVLFEKIRQEKQKLTKQGKIKKEKNESTIFVCDDKQHYEKFADGTIKNIESEIPFDIPSTWCWCRLYDYVNKVTDYVASGSFASLHDNVKYYKEANYALMVKTADFSNNFTKDLTYTDKHGYDYLSNSNLYGGELILSNVGSIGKIFTVPYLDIPMTLAPNAIMIRFINDRHRDWIKYLFLSNIGYNLLKSISSATAISKFNKTDFKKLLIPIPPLSEQQRIVDKVEELFRQVDAIEEEKQALLKLVDKAKEKVLDLAMKGKLVKQDPNDEPASVILEKIFEEKKKLAKESKIKLSKNELLQPTISDDNDYYKKLNNNIEVPLGEVCFLTKPNMLRNGYLPYLEVKYLRGQINSRKVKNGLFICRNSHAILVDGENSGEVFDINEDGYLGSTFMQLLILNCINTNYIKYFIDYNKKYLKNNKKGSAIPHLNKELFKNLKILLPTKKQQDLIVNKLNIILKEFQTIKAEL
jgi:type I restriction enzyme S subunit